jgi:hypothetical protein
VFFPRLVWIRPQSSWIRLLSSWDYRHVPSWQLVWLRLGFAFFFFFCLDWLWTMILLISAS